MSRRAGGSSLGCLGGVASLLVGLSLLAPAAALAQQASDGFATASVSIRFADKVDATGAAGLVFQDFPTQSVTATASASLAFQGDPERPGALSASAEVSVLFQNHTETIPTWIASAASLPILVTFEGVTLPAPVISSISATAGIQGTALTAFTVTGANLDAASVLFFSGAGVTVESYVARSSTEIVANVRIASNATPGLRDVGVVNPDTQQAVLTGAFEVVAAPELLFNVSTGGSAFPQGATIPFSAVVFDASAPGVPLTSSAVTVALTVEDATSARILGPAALAYNAVTGQFAGTLTTSGLALGSYLATFTFSRPDGLVVERRTATFELVGTLSLTVASNKPMYGRGESVGLTGEVRDPSGAPVPGLAVALAIRHGDVTRDFSVFSNAQGGFGFIYSPDPAEAGTYVATARALSGGAGGEASTSFTVHGLRMEPASSTAEMAMNSSLQVALQVRNIGDTDLADVTLTVQDVNLADGVTATIDVASVSTLAAGAVQDLVLTVQAAAGTAPALPAVFRLTGAAAGGVIDTGTVSVSLRNAAGVAVVDPPSAAVGLEAGTSRLIGFTLRNEQDTAITNAQVVVEQPEIFPWVSIQGAALGTVASGEERSFAVSLQPPSDLAAGPYELRLEVSTSTGVVVVPITVEITSSLIRVVSLQVSDDAARDVGGAALQLVSTRLLGATGTGTQESPEIYQGTTDDAGHLDFPAVAAGTYVLRVQAAGHADYEAQVAIEPGSAPQAIDVILSTTVVAFSFSVTPTAITDSYDVALVVTYSTDLIKPALVTTPSRIDLSMPGGDAVPGRITIANSHAQTSVTNVQIDATALGLSDRFHVHLCADGTEPCGDGAPAALSIGTLGPGQTVVLHYRITLDPGPEPTGGPLGTIAVTGDYTYSLRGQSMPGTTASPILVAYRKPESLRMFPPLRFVYDTRDGVPGVLEYTGATTRVTLENRRVAALDLQAIDGEPTWMVGAVQLSLPANTPADQVPLSALDVPPIWSGVLEGMHLAANGGQTAFDITSGGNTLLEAIRQRLREGLPVPRFIAVAGRWEDAQLAQGFVFPISIATLSAGEVSVTEGGWSPCGTCGWGGSILGGTAPPQPFNNHGIVKVEIDQKVSLEREAFDARLEIYPAVASLDGFTAVLDIRDAEGNDASDRFVVVPTIPASPIVGNETAHWLIIPKVAAGGDTPAGLSYTAAVHIAYSVRGVPATFDTAPESFTVLPLPRLTLSYTVPYVVMGNIPFKLEVDVTNTGGTANDVTIESAQPRIIENVSQLDIDFRIDGSSSTGADADFRLGDLTIPFGTIASGQTRSGYWRTYATMRGFIVDFTSNVVHRTLNGVVLDPIIEVVTGYSRALGGRVTASCNLGPLTVSLQGTSATTVTDANGDYYLTDLPSGTYLLAISRPAGAPVTRQVGIMADQPTDFVDVGDEELGALDSDLDQMPDCWELEEGFNPDDASDAAMDPDSDGLTNRDEYLQQTDPYAADSDGDDFWDGVEFRAGTDPNDSDDKPRLRARVVSESEAITLDWDADPTAAVADVHYEVRYCEYSSGGSCDPSHGSVFAPEPPTQDQVRIPDLTNASEYRFRVFSVRDGAVPLALWNDVFAVPGRFAFGVAPEHPPEPIVFVHGIWSSAETWNDTASFMRDTLGWSIGGQLSYDESDENGPDDPTRCPTSGQDCPSVSGPRWPDPFAIRASSDSTGFVPTGDIFAVTFGDSSANYSDRGGLWHQTTELSEFVRHIGAARVTVVAHSMGGVVARAHATFRDEEARTRQLITYGSPHWGVNLAGLIGWPWPWLQSDGARDLDVDCTEDRATHTWRFEFSLVLIRSRGRVRSVESVFVLHRS